MFSALGLLFNLNEWKNNLFGNLKILLIAGAVVAAILTPVLWVKAIIKDKDTAISERDTARTERDGFKKQAEDNAAAALKAQDQNDAWLKLIEDDASFAKKVSTKARDRENEILTKTSNSDDGPIAPVLSRSNERLRFLSRVRGTATKAGNNNH